MSLPPEEIPFPVEAPPPVEGPPGPPEPVRQAPPPRQSPARRTAPRRKAPPQEGGDAWFWETLSKTLVEVMKPAGRAIVENGLVKGQYWPGLLRLYAGNQWAEGWMSRSEQRELVERYASMQAGRSVRMEVIRGEAPRARQMVDPARPPEPNPFTAAEPEEAGSAPEAAQGASPEANYQAFLAQAREQDIVEFVED